ncbi:ATP-binding protein, partial [Streptomyces sp. E11-3]|uniref:ATP-binding protein n=1 Tax=Streptomyces sp. E11-3 TaxID=3110112 RepID=UPI00397F82B0
MIEIPELAAGGLAAGTLSALFLGGGLLRSRRGRARQRDEIATLHSHLDVARQEVDRATQAFTAEVVHLAQQRIPAAATRTAHPHLTVPGPLRPEVAGTELGVGLEGALDGLRTAIAQERKRVDAAARAGMRGATREIQAGLYRLQDVLRGLQQRYDDPELTQTLFTLDHENEQSLRRAQVAAVVCGAWVGLAREESHLVEAVTGGQARLVGYHRVQVHHHLEDGTALVSHAVEPVAIIVAELLDNALRHSSPDTDVVVNLERVHHGVTVTIDDAGVGMAADERAHAQRMVAGSDPILLSELGDPPRMGLAAIGQLTRQFDLSVDLSSPSPYGGVRAVLLVKKHLLSHIDPTEQPPAASAPRSTRRDDRHTGSHPDLYAADRARPYTSDHAAAQAGGRGAAQPVDRAAPRADGRSAAQPAGHTAPHAGSQGATQRAGYTDPLAGSQTDAHTPDRTGGHAEGQDVPQLAGRVAPYAGEHADAYAGDRVGPLAGDQTDAHTPDHTSRHAEGQGSPPPAGRVAPSAEDHADPYAGRQTDPHTPDHTSGHAGSQGAPQPGGHTAPHPEGQGAPYAGEHAAAHAGDRTDPHAGNQTGPHTPDHTGGHAEGQSALHAGDLAAPHAGNQTDDPHTPDHTSGHAGSQGAAQPADHAAPHALHQTNPHTTDRTDPHAGDRPHPGAKAAYADGARAVLVPSPDPYAEAHSRPDDPTFAREPRTGADAAAPDGDVLPRRRRRVRAGAAAPQAAPAAPPAPARTPDEAAAALGALQAGTAAARGDASPAPADSPG